MRKARMLGMLICLIVGLSVRFVSAQSAFASSFVVLNGESKGGVLTLMPVPGWNYPYVAMSNRPGESAASVVGRLALELSACSNCTSYFGRNPVLEIKENGLVLLGGGRKGGPAWIFGGTELGFNIPQAPTALSVSYVSNSIILRWINQPGAYDSIGVFYSGIAVAQLSGTMSEFVYDGQYAVDKLFPSTDVAFQVVASKDGTPSNGSGVRFRNHVSQESLMNVPFKRGVAPSFETWSVGITNGNLEVEQGNLPGMEPKAETRNFEANGFFQKLNGHGRFNGGVSRRFIGLTPGRTYRIKARMNTLRSGDGIWSFSFHAAFNMPGSNSLTTEQMSGSSELPDHTMGPTAGLLALCDSATLTKGNWVVRSSDSTSANTSSRDITLPGTSDSITVWFRLQGEGSTDVSVGLDSVTVEELP